MRTTTSPLLIVYIIVGLCIIFASAAYTSIRQGNSKVSPGNLSESTLYSDSFLECLKDYKYDAITDVEYHIDSPETVISKGIWVKDPATGNVVYKLWTDVSNTTRYYPPDQYKYGNRIFVPTYEESVYLSRGGSNQRWI